MAINFPDNPTVNQIYTYNDRSWTWSGTVWTPNRSTYTPERDIVTDDEGYLVASSATATEVSYLSGVTSAVQTQLNAKAPLASPALTGTPTAPTAAADTNTTQVATTAYVVGQASSSEPLSNGTADAGTSLKFSREDHVHPTDVNLAPKNNPTFTGTVTVSSSGIQFADGVQSLQGVPSLTPIKPNITANVTTSTLTSALTYRDTIAAVAGAFSITVDADTTNGITFPVGTTISFYQSVGAGGASIVAGASVNLLATPGLVFRDQYSSVSITKVAANTWLVFGDLKA